MTKQELESKINEFCDEERLNEKVSRTVVDYKNCLMKFYNFIPTDSFNLSRSLAADYKLYLTNSLEQGIVQATSANKYVIIFNKFMKYLGKNEIKIHQFRTQGKTSLENQMSNQEHKRMLRKAKECGYDEAYMIIKTFAQSGTRISELRYLTVENLEKYKNYIPIYSKSKERKIILIGDLYRELKRYCKENKIKEGYIFRSPDPKFISDPNKMINPSTIWRQLKKIGGIARVNLNHIHPHGWRHLFAIAYLKTPGATIDELADILGHSKIETTRIYTRTTLKEKKEKMEQIKF